MSAYYPFQLCFCIFETLLAVKCIVFFIADFKLFSWDSLVNNSSGDLTFFPTVINFCNYFLELQNIFFPESIE